MNRTFSDTLPKRLPSGYRIVRCVGNRFDGQVNSATVGQNEGLVERQLSILHRGNGLCLHSHPFLT
jgi:hypothetical protein